MTNKVSQFVLTSQQRDELLETFGSLLKEKVILEQSIWEQKEQAKADNETLFLELLEIFDALESLINYLADNLEANSQNFKRLLKSLTATQKKLLIFLEKREVTLINFPDSQPDFRVCQVVDREIRNDLDEQTITQVIRQGFWLGDKVLRPLEVITSRLEK
jgi:molecular chaperone GrpE